ncbi:hypothetical protein [Actinomyces oris]|uniref:hypothetical protein n=1 Tax=Actinomyces oris TaxID=544580 RepID=UPI0028D65079|nr:hypothetical protein [Actinomyces oris]
MQSISNLDRGEVNSLSKSPQLDVLLAGYAAQRADCSAIYGASTSMLGFIVGTMGFVAIVVGDPSRVPPIWLALAAMLPWGMLSYHSLIVGMNAGHSYVCEVYEQLIAEAAPEGLIYHDKGKKGKIILGVTVGERFLDPRRASVSRSAASFFAFFASLFLPILYSASILSGLWSRSWWWFMFAVTFVSIGFVIVLVNHVKNLVRPEVKEIDELLTSFR